MKIAVSGATGFIGSHAQRAFAEKGWATAPLLRGDFAGDGSSLREKLSQAHAVVNLAGAPIAARWTERYKRELHASRIPVTEKIVAAMADLAIKPQAFVSASGAGLYPPGGPWTEDSPQRAGDFLGLLARDWEHAALQARSVGIRTVVYRFGVALGRGGGALARMLPVFRLGLGGILGSGNQPFSWIHIRDLTRALCAAIENASFQGSYNLTAPNPTTNRGLTRALARTLNRPAVLPVPACVLKMLFGQGATVLLDGQSVLPRRLMAEGFSFKYERIEDALQNIAGAGAASSILRSP